MLRPEDRPDLWCMLEGRALEGRSKACRAYGNAEVQLLNAVVRMRGTRRSGDQSRFLRGHEGFATAIEKAVNDAWAKPNPLEREQELDRCRWHVLEDLGRSDPFGLGRVLAFAGQLRLAWRWVRWDSEQGRRKLESYVEQKTRPEHGDGFGGETDGDRL